MLAVLPVTVSCWKLDDNQQQRCFVCAYAIVPSLCICVCTLYVRSCANNKRSQSLVCQTASLVPGFTLGLTRALLIIYCCAIIIVVNNNCQFNYVC